MQPSPGQASSVLALCAESDCFVVVEARLNLDRYVCRRVGVCVCVRVFFVCVAVTKFACAAAAAAGQCCSPWPGFGSGSLCSLCEKCNFNVILT